MTVVPPPSRVTVLFLAANPTDTRRVRLEDEYNAIKEALRTAAFGDRFHLVPEWAVRPARLQRLLAQHHPDVVHFAGHGDGEGQILLEDDAGIRNTVNPSALADLFGVLRNHIRCVVLNACSTAPQATAIAEHIDCVIGTSKKIGNVAAVNFATGFYQALGDGYDLDTAFKLGCNQIHLQNLGEQDTPKLIAPRVDPTTIHLIGPETIAAAGEAIPAGIVVGQPPPLAAAYQPRGHASARIEAAFSTTRLGGEPVHTVLLSGDGGVGKTQLATGIFTHATTTTPLRVWVPATTLDTLLTGYATAGAAVGARNNDDPDLTVRAAGFLQWLAGPGATQPWLIVLDDLTLTPTQMRDWWPPATPTGRNLVTTRRRDAAFDGHGRTRIPLTVYNPAEALAYLTDRLTPHLEDDLSDDALTQAPALAADLGCLPVALAQAAAVIIDTAATCAGYREQFADRSLTLGDLFPAWATADSYTRTVATTWSLAIEAADRLPPVGLARPAAHLAAVLDPSGAPLGLWATTSARTYLATHRSDAPARATELVSAAEAQAAVRALARLSLITITPGATSTGVRIHALAQRAIRDTLDPTHLSATIRTAADALLEIWPPFENNPNLTAVLRANVTNLDDLDPTTLWTPDIHTVLFQAATSLGEIGLVTQARDHYQRVSLVAADLLGPDHADTLTARANHASWRGAAGDPAGAVKEFADLLTDRQRNLGPDHPDTLTTRHSLARWRGAAGDPAGAVKAFAELLTNRQRNLGPDHPDTLTTRHSLAYWRGAAGDPAGASKAFEELLPDKERVLGPDHPDTLTTRGSLAYWRGEAGDNPTGAAKAFDELLPDMERVLGPDHPHTLTTRAHLARWRGEAGDPAGAAEAFDELLPDVERVLGPDHPDSLSIRANLARWRGEAGDPAGAANALDELLTDRLHILGPDHPDTLANRNDLARWRGEAGQAGAAKAYLLGARKRGFRW